MDNLDSIEFRRIVSRMIVDITTHANLGLGTFKIVASYFTDKQLAFAIGLSVSQFSKVSNGVCCISTLPFFRLLVIYYKTFGPQKLIQLVANF